MREPARAAIAASGKGQSEDVGFQYNDDCFGLIFLAGLLYEKDVAFAATFAALTFAAAFAARQGTVKQQLVDDGLVPAAVAVLSLLAASAIALAVGTEPALARPAEVIVCAISVAVGIGRPLLRLRAHGEQIDR
jgi:hypothetical protein